MVERRRREAVARELNRGRPTLVHTDFSKASEADKAIVRHVTQASRVIEELYALQQGSFGLRACLVPGDPGSQALFRRNQGPWCRAPGTEKDPFCNACPDFPKQRPGWYPPELAGDPGMCKKLAAHKDADRLLDPFVVIRGSGDNLRVVPYNQEWGGRMKRVAEELRAAAGVIPAGEEKAFKKYLMAAAQGFESNSWQPVDEAWAAMNAANSKWYLRIGPDEVYDDPCGRKAGFHTSFALIDKDSLYWQEKLTPLRQEMETELAKLIGLPYAARKVSFGMPDFIEIVLNAGEARDPMGATVGQSLPNWGKVADEGRGRTVVMSNLYTDPDSRAIHRAVADALFSRESLKFYTDDKRLSLLSTILHEAAHNYGPHSDYKIDGKRPSKIFGGATAVVLEELKAQTGAMYYVDFLQKRGILTAEEANKVYLRSIIWCFSHISRGMFDAEGLPKPYSQVAAIHVASFMQEGAMSWQADQLAANGKDQGRFTMHYDKMAAAVTLLMQRVGKIKATGDVDGAKKLIGELITGVGFKLVHSPEVTERILRNPKASFTYSVTF
jgi:hypothetical protein